MSTYTNLNPHAIRAAEHYFDPDRYPSAPTAELAHIIDTYAIAPAVAELQAQLQHKARELASATGYLAEAQAEIARLKANIGCAREQKSTQFCAEVAGSDKRIAELEEALQEIALVWQTQSEACAEGGSAIAHSMWQMAREALAKKGQP